MNDRRKDIVKAVLFGFGFALIIAGFCMIIAAACKFTWLKMIGAVCAFGSGLTMVLTGGYMELNR